MTQRTFVGMIAGILLPALCGAAQLVINELHFQPADKTVPGEFLELYNRSDDVMDLTGWSLSGAVSFAFPEGKLVGPHGYVVVAEEPEVLEHTMGATSVMGPYEGRLANEGEPVYLRNAAGAVLDTVAYAVGFPWPVATSGRGASLELINPDLDNAVPASWRPSGLVERGPIQRQYLIPPEDPGWHYRPGTSEASDPPDAWRQVEFPEDDTWAVGQTSIGYGDGDDRTELPDMWTGYSSLYLRREFTLASVEDVPAVLELGLYIDDGAVVWINGREIERQLVPEGELPFDGTATQSREAAWEFRFLDDPAGLLRPGKNVVAVHGFNWSANNPDFSCDLQLFVPGVAEGEAVPPTPGRRNAAWIENPPPAILEVGHAPRQPPAGQPFTVTARITDADGVDAVDLTYQVVLPGEYVPAHLPLPHQTLLAEPTTPFPPNPAFEDPAAWDTVSMTDGGTGGDAVPGDGVYTATVPGQVNRALVRYRVVARDRRGAVVRVPYADDPSLNFACFVYNGVPPYVTTQRSVHPEGVGHVYGVDVMTSLPVYTVIARAQDLEQCIAYNSSFRIPKSNEAGRDKFNWEAAFVYEGIVYDHIRYRLRQANDRYGGTGKRSFRFRFNRGQYLAARDNYGRAYPYRWRTLNTGKMFDNKDVGNFGLTETMNHLLWNMMGVPAPWTHTFHLRVVQGPDEAPEGALGQYLGDFWGMHLNFEDYDAVFVETHQLADGNLYKLKSGIFDGNELKRNQGRNAVTGDEDFQNIRHHLRPDKTPAWLDAHVSYDRWYGYHAVAEAVRHYDFRPHDSHSKNRAWYFEPYRGSRYGRLWTLPWDSDASWGPNWNSGIDYSKQAIWSGADKEPYRIAYRNTIRQFRDLVWTEEVIHRMIDDLAERIVAFARADRDRWRGAPAQAGFQDFGTLEAKVADMKRFAFVGWSGSTGPTVPAGGRARHLDTLAAAGGDAAAIPDTPVVTYQGPSGFPSDGLHFSSSPFSDPQGGAPAAVAWRIGETTPPGTAFDPRVPRVYEYPAVWEEVFEHELLEVTIPLAVVKPGSVYRVRVRMQDGTGRWSHWSAPSQFTAGEPANGVGGLQLPGDLNQDGRLTISDAVALLRHYAGGADVPFPCAGGGPDHESNRVLLDSDGDGTVDLTDAIYLLTYLFRSGPAPVRGTTCVFLTDCPDICSGQ
jgi:hypothetical protein